MAVESGERRTLGLLGATGVGVGAIVGGGILALAGVAFAATGPSAVVAFAANGLIALLTALSFAEMSAAFPESGGTYTFAKKVLSVEAAFMVGWVVWFASIVAAVLYALGFAAYAAVVLGEVARFAGAAAPPWLAGRGALLALALGATAFYTLGLLRRATGGGQWATVGKVVVFLVLIVGGLAALPGREPESLRRGLSPFFAHGAGGLIQAMGFTFIALQGFDLIAAVGGEVRRPRRNLPRAMLLSLAAALVIYLPLLLLIATVGVEPGGSITDLSARNPETVVALAARTYMGEAGYWLVLAAALMAMLSALQANLLAASRVAQVMARDRALPNLLGRLHATFGTPVAAVLATAVMVAVVLLLIPDVAAAGAASSLIFLISFATAHWTNILVRRRGGAGEGSLRLPWFPAIPLAGGLACLALAVFQGFAVPAAGFIAGGWLALGVALFVALFARRARVVDASAEAVDPDLVRLRGRNPLVLVPIANPASARGLVKVASALAPPVVGRVLLLSVVRPPERWQPGETPRQLRDAQAVLGESLTASFAAALAPEALITISPRPWEEIGRISRAYRCESLLLGLGHLGAGGEELEDPRVEELMRAVDGDVVVLRAPPGWELSSVRRVLVPVGGRRDQSQPRARLLGSLIRAGARDIAYLGVFPEDAPAAALARARRELGHLAHDETAGRAGVRVLRSVSVAAEVVRRAADSDLVVLGLQRRGRGRLFGTVPLRIASETRCAMIMISSRA